MFEDKYHLQTFRSYHNFENCHLEFSQLLWGTNWNGFVFEKRITGESSIWLGGSWSGWEAWSSSSVWGGKEIQIFDSGSGIEVKGWTLLGRKFERLIEINISQISGVSELGIFIRLFEA